MKNRAQIRFFGKSVFFFLAFLALVSFGGSLEAATILSLDSTRTGNENEAGDNRYLTSVSMTNATNVLLSAGFTIQTSGNFLAGSTAGANILYTGTVSTPFSAAEITNVQSFVSAGGGLVIQRDWDAFYPASDPLLAAFGVTVNTSPIGPGGTANPVIKSIVGPHPIWDGPAGSVTTYDQVYSSSITGGATKVGGHTTAVGPNAIGYLSFNLGRVVVLTDMDAWDDLGDTVNPTPGSNNAIVWENIFHYASPTAPIPEPSTLILLGVGLAAIGIYKRRNS